MDGKGREMKEKEENTENKVKCKRKGIKGVGVLWLYDKEKGTGVFGFPLCDSNITPPPPPLPGAYAIPPPLSSVAAGPWQSEHIRVERECVLTLVWPISLSDREGRAQHSVSLPF